MKRRMIITAALTVALFSLEAQEGEDCLVVVPLLNYEYFQCEDRALNAFGGGGFITDGGEDPGFLLVALYSYHEFSGSGNSDYPSRFSNGEFLLQKKWDRQRFFSLLKSYSDKPVYGGFNTFAFVNGWGYDVISGDHHILTLGASLGLGDTGLALPLCPLPYFRYELHSIPVYLALDFTTSPMGDIILNPEGRIRAGASLLVTDFGTLTEGGMKYDFSLEYRLFEEDSSLGDFAGIKAGFQREDYSYDLAGEKDRTWQFGWDRAYGTLDLSLLEITAAYLIAGTERYSHDADRDLGEGFSLSIQLAYLF